jgi:hypothetical protein
MAKKAAGTGTKEGGSIASYFKAIFKANPKLLNTRSNDELLQGWLADHPREKEVPERIKANLANVKSVLRKKKRRKPAKNTQPADAVAAAVAQKPAQTSTRGFERLEEQIDDCLSTARILDREALHNVISLLRRARNAVVWKLGE